ncbi:hypothetical protein DFH29DRAFT_1007449 [Suillus ampliporus]|nr:hypothetical protein DFH29DRAFT_1007449 [Suillus ampliporus]
MSRKLQSSVLCALLVAKGFIFEDVETLHEIYGLGPEMFDVKNPHLTEQERKALQKVIAAVVAADNLKQRYDILEKKDDAPLDAGRAALTKWFKQQKVSPAISGKIDDVWERLELSPLHLIQDAPDEQFPEIRDADGAREDIIAAIFGDNALSQTLRGEFRETFGTIVHHSWERHRKRYTRAKKSLRLNSIAAASYCQAIEEAEIVTTQMLRDATKAVKAYRDGIRWFPNELEKIAGVAEHEEFLKEVVVNAVAKAKRVPKEKLAQETEDTPARRRGRQRARKVKVSLAAAGDVDLIWPMYVQLFEVIPTEAEGLRLNLDLGDETGHDAWNSSDDLGVDSFRHLDDATLNHLLHFPDGRPALFAEFRSQTGKCAWDDPASKDFVQGNPDMQPLSLLWHQRVGIASLVDKFWLSEETSAGVPGVLVADEVGVGKTALIMGTIAFTIDAYWVQQFELGKGKPYAPLVAVDPSKVRKAPILEERPFFAGQRTIPDLPHVIIVPNSLAAQWYSELRTFFAPKTIEIYQYPTAEKEFAAFWTGPWAESKMPKVNRIILVTHSVMTTSGRAFDIRKGKKGHNSGKALDEKRSVKNRTLEKKCIWHQQEFLTTTVDEGHEFRNPSSNYYSLLEIERVTHLRMVTTATPLYTSPKDLCNLGRLLRIPYFVGEEGDEREKEAWKAVLAARRGISREEKESAAAHTIQLLAAGKTDHDEPVSESRSRVQQTTMVWIGDIRRGYLMRVIRRTVDSQRFDGKKINDSLPPYKMIIITVHLYGDEQAIIDKAMDKLTGRKGIDVLDHSASFNSKFYLEGRTKVAFPWHESPLYEPVESLDQWGQCRSTKVDQLITLTTWHLISDDHQVYKDLDKDDRDQTDQDPKELLNEINADHPNLMTMGTRKVLIYMEFPMMAPLIVSVLKLYNIHAMTLNGGHTVDERNEIVRKFNTDPAARVLLFSNVGAVGLNLTVANIVILFDQCWSRMLVNQIIGRAWRLGQEDTVLVYNMIALGTVDVLMLDHGEGKGKMLGEFLTTNQAVARTIKRATRGQQVQDSDGDSDEIEEVTPPVPPPPTAGPSGGTSLPSSGISRPSAASGTSLSSGRSSGGAGPSRPAGLSTSDKTATNKAPNKALQKKPAKGYGGKGKARNIAQTGDDDGEVFDAKTVDCDDNDKEMLEEQQGDESDDDVVPVRKGKAKASATVKEPGKVNTKSKPRMKPMPKSKAKEAKKAKKAKEANAKSTAQSSMRLDIQGGPSASQATGVASGRILVPDSDGDQQEGSPRRTAMDVDSPTTFDQDMSPGQRTTRSSTPDRDAVDNMLGHRSLPISQLSLVTRDEESDIVQKSQPTQALGDSTASKRRRDTTSTVMSTSPSGPVRSPEPIHRARKRAALCTT